MSGAVDQCALLFVTIGPSDLHKTIAPKVIASLLYEEDFVVFVLFCQSQSGLSEKSISNVIVIGNLRGRGLDLLWAREGTSLVSNPKVEILGRNVKGVAHSRHSNSNFLGLYEASYSKQALSVYFGRRLPLPCQPDWRKPSGKSSRP